MSTSSTTTLTVLISVLLAASVFIALAGSQQIPVIKVNEQQAINILKESDKTNHRIVNGTITTLSTDLEYVSLNWTSYFRNVGTEPHSRIYVSDTTVGESKPYWFIHYESTWDYGWSGGSGTYIVDAQSGEIMLSLERIGGGVSVIGPDYLMSFQPEAWDSNNPLVAKLGVFTPITLTLTAEPYYHASLPASIRVTNVPLGFEVGLNNAFAILNTGESVSFILTVFTPVSYPTDFLPPQADSHPHFDVEISFLGQTASYPVYIVQSNKYPVSSVVIDQFIVSDPRCDVNSTQFVRLHAKWDNGTDVREGSIKINDDNTLFNGTGWASLSEVSNVPAKRVYFVKAVNCSGVTDFTQVASSPSIIWDRVDVTLSIFEDRIDVGSNASIEWTAVYAFDGTPFKGSVVFSSPLIGDLPDDTPGQSLQLDHVGKARFTADAIHDDQYGLTWFTTNSVDCVWDRVRITQGGVSNQLTKAGNMETVWFKARYEYDYSSFTGESTADGGVNKMFVGGVPLEWSSIDKVWKYSTKLDDGGKLTFEVTGVEDVQFKLTKFFDDAGPQSITWEKP